MTRPNDREVNMSNQDYQVMITKDIAAQYSRETQSGWMYFVREKFPSFNVLIFIADEFDEALTYALTHMRETKRVHAILLPDDNVITLKSEVNNEECNQ